MRHLDAPRCCAAEDFSLDRMDQIVEFQVGQRFFVLFFSNADTGRDVTKLGRCAGGSSRRYEHPGRHTR